MISPEAKVEAVIHHEVAALLQRLSDEHGVQVRDINVQWSDFSESHGTKFTIYSLTVHTFSRGKR